MIYDNHNRPITYLRLAVTDRCNLRCFYCMPEEGIKYLPKHQVLTFEEMERVVRVLARLGVQKVRITGGEPFVRSGLMDFMHRLAEIDGLDDLSMTTNGVLTAPHIEKMAALGVKAVNLSLDTLDRERFRKITRRDELPAVLKTLDALLKAGIQTKINAVVMEGQNTQDILPLAEMTRDLPVDVRFIEEMPFNGEGSHYPVLHWTHRRIVDEIRSHYPDLQKQPDPPFSTSATYQIPGHQGTIGVIAAFSRTFCGTCNRIRLTAQGTLKTCLYDNGVLDVRALLRGGASDSELTTAFLQAFSHRPANGFEAEQQRETLSGIPISESMSTIGG
ncbi:GTP 3',8-cyclase MoaA [Spirosoma endophyticum]|uniref:GTP 3',8-cyclase n=1 Tax=Spirosoma endophyticum TaxID=662367 RepID=A0A1I1QY58_9BACT|nr:GTP 3',8-cyclase MoaA [Spirosoma endophyticum]SFD26917.1 cyclic pyranopterin monophosphate synthase subunit MoaA [Spirosoma endophyticum]